MNAFAVPEVDDHSLRSGDSSNNDEIDDELGESTSRHDCGQSSSAGSMSREMNEIEELAREDTKMLRVWRRIVTCIMLGTFIVVLSGAIVFLKKEEKETAHDDVSQAMEVTFHH